MSINLHSPLANTNVQDTDPDTHTNPWHDQLKGILSK